MADVILVLNAGSSSIKFSAFDVEGDALELVTHGQVEALFSAPHFVAYDRRGEKSAEHSWGEGAKLQHAEAIAHLGAYLRGHGAGHRLVGVGHRVVHGGARFTKPVLTSPEVLDELDKLTPLAPLHQPHNLRPIRIVAERNPGLPQVACFDTAFHHGHPFTTATFGLPRRYFAAGVRRYGFHGLSYEYIAARLAATEPALAAGRVVVAHLGNGASMCALRAGRSVATTMSFTALDGLPMGTRCGQLDPGAVLYMMAQENRGAEEIQRILYDESGLRGLSGLSHDMRVLEESGQPAAAEAIAYFVHRVRYELGGLASVLGGLDGLVFCGGIGEHAAMVREQALTGLEWLGVTLDRAANRAGGPLLSTPASRVRVLVIPTDEEAMIARHTAALTGGG
jgi:acetate kinase